MSQATDRAEITDLVARLAHLLDERRFDDLRTLYAVDAETDTPRGNLHGIDEIIDMVRRTSPPEELTQHLNTSVMVDLDGDQAEVRSQQLVYFFHEGAPPHRTSGLQATYAARRTPDGWRLTRLRVVPRWYLDR